MKIIYIVTKVSYEYGSETFGIEERVIRAYNNKSDADLLAEKLTIEYSDEYLFDRMRVDGIPLD